VRPQSLHELHPVIINGDPKRKPSKNMNVFVGEILCDSLCKVLGSGSPSLLSLNEKIPRKYVLIPIDYAQYQGILILEVYEVSVSINWIMEQRTPLKQSKLEICLLRAATCTLCALVSRSEASSATEWACFQTESSTSSSATRFSSSAFRLTVAVERSRKASV
jgi:hypothetical protein